MSSHLETQPRRARWFSSDLSRNPLLSTTWGPAPTLPCAQHRHAKLLPRWEVSSTSQEWPKVKQAHASECSQERDSEAGCPGGSMSGRSDFINQQSTAFDRIAEPWASIADGWHLILNSQPTWKSKNKIIALKGRAPHCSTFPWKIGGSSIETWMKYREWLRDGERFKWD